MTRGFNPWGMFFCLLFHTSSECLYRFLERNQSQCVLAECIPGGFFLMKRPLGDFAPGYGNSGPAIGRQSGSPNRLIENVLSFGNMRNILVAGFERGLRG